MKKTLSEFLVTFRFFNFFNFSFCIYAVVLRLIGGLLRLIGWSTYQKIFMHLKKWVPITYMRVRCKDGITFLIRVFDWDDIVILHEVIVRKDYEKVFVLEKGDIVMDVGAHIGSFSVRSAKLVGSTGLIVAFEPDTNNFYLLKKNVALNQIKNIVLVNIALGKEIGSGCLKIPVLRSGNISFKKNLKGDVELKSINIMPLDVYLKGRFSRVDFLKIDVEGSELDVLKGAQETITKNLMRIVLETHSQQSKKQIVQYLTSKGYAVLSIPPYLYASNRPDDKLLIRRLIRNGKKYIK